MTLDAFFNPKSVAVIGASRHPGEPGHVIFRNFFEGAFKGKVYPVNPNADELFGHKCYGSVLDIPGKIDLAVIVVPAKVVPKVIAECGKKHVPAAIVISAGFREIGNAKLEDEVRRIAKKSKVRIVGTNCIGIFVPSTGVDTVFNPTYKLERPEKGNIAFVTQSGAIGTVILDWMAMKGYTLSKFVSYGNATDVDETDLIGHLAKDKDTSVICAYFEGLERGRKFFEKSRQLSKRIPIIAHKGGVTEAGIRAVSSHTGSLAGSAQVCSAAFRQAGIIQADDLEELFDFARVLSTQPIPRGRRVQIITDGGGFGVLMSDGLVKHGLELASLNKASVSKLKKQLPPYFVVSNPLDLTGNATSEYYAAALEHAVNDPNIDMIALIILFQIPGLTPEVIETVIEINNRSKKPIVVISAGGRYTEVLKKSLEDSGVPCFSYPERAAKAMKVLYEYGRYRGKK